MGRSRSRSRSPPRSGKRRGDSAERARELLQKRKAARESTTSWDKTPGAGSMMSAASGQPGSGQQMIVNPQTLRQAKRLYIGNVPSAQLNEEILKVFLNTALLTAAGKDPNGHGPINVVQINPGKNFAFAEFASLDACTAALSLDGIMCEGNALKIHRPRDYQPLPEGYTDTPGSSFAATNLLPNIISTSVPDSPFKLFLGGLPSHLTEEQVKQLLLSFGQLRAFNMVKDGTTGKPKGYAFAEFADHGVTATAIEGLNGMKIGDKSLVAQLSTPETQRGATPSYRVPPPPGPGMSTDVANQQAAQVVVMSVPMGTILGQLPAVQATDFQPTNVVLLLNLFHHEKDLQNDDDREDALADVREEMAQYGTLQDLQLQRAAGGNTRWIVRVVYADVESAEKAQKALGGRKFNGRAVVTTYGVAA